MKYSIKVFNNILCVTIADQYTLAIVTILDGSQYTGLGVAIFNGHSNRNNSCRLFYYRRGDKFRLGEKATKEALARPQIVQI